MTKMGILSNYFFVSATCLRAALIILLVSHLTFGERNAMLRLSSGAELPGQYVRVGAVDTIVTGVMREMGNCTKKSESSEDTSTEWIAVISLPEVDEPEHQKRTAQSTTCSILEQVKQAILLGGSALLILACKPVLMKQLETDIVNDKPIIAVTNRRDVAIIKKDMSSSNQVKAVISPVDREDILATPKLTLWSTCGRSSGGTFREWEGTVCYGRSITQNHLYFSTLWQVIFSGIVSVYLLFMFRNWRRPFHPIEDVEDSLQRLAKYSVSKMPTKRYKRKKYRDEPDKDSCSICLDEFHHGQLIRMLPCYHHYHSKCVDVWLIKKRTCPLCKMDIVDQRFRCSRGLSS